MMEYQESNNKTKSKNWLCRLFRRGKDKVYKTNVVDETPPEIDISPSISYPPIKDFQRFRNFVYSPEVDDPSTASRSSGNPVPVTTQIRITDDIHMLKKHFWYWGPLSTADADEVLDNKPDGSFLVRDSSSSSYFFTISFRSVGSTLHSRIEHSQGKYNLYGSYMDGFPTIPELIEQAIQTSQKGVYCYSKRGERYYCDFPVRLTTPVSRYRQVRSLKYLCRFVIRDYTNINDIPKLPLPTTLYKYLLEPSYF